MAIKAQHTFVGLDTDTADRFIKEGSYRDALNVHIGSSEDNGVMSVETVKGNTLVTYSLPSGTNQIIGSHEDIVNKCVYYFLCNEYVVPNLTTYAGASGLVTIQNNDSQPSGIISSDLVKISTTTPDGDKWIVRFPGNGNVYTLVNPLRFIDLTNDAGYSGTFSGVGTITRYKHSILKYDAITNTISLVYQHSRLNFDADYPITGTSLINGILSWTDDYNPPRSLRIADASTYNSFFVEALVDFVRTPPSVPVACTSSLDSNISNYMKDKSYQFIYRYVYKDESRSVWSGLSELIPTGYLDSKKNKIILTIQNEETTNFLLYSKIIKGIELAFRDSDIFNFKFIANIVFPTASTSTSYTFLNDRGYTIISTEETTHLFESIPIIAGSMEAIRNRIFFGNCVEGFDVDNTLFSSSDITYTTKTIPDKNVLGFKSGSIFDIGVVFFDRAQRKSGVQKLRRATTEKLQLDGTGTKRYIGARIIFTLSGKPPIWATRYQMVRTKNLSTSFFLQGACIVISTTSNPEKETTIMFNGLNGNVTYVPTAGDFFSIIKPISNFTNFPIKYKVVRGEGNMIVVEGSVPPTFSGGLASYEFQYCEISTDTLPDTIYYEMSNSYPVLSPHTESRRFGSDNLNANKIIDISSGDISVKNIDDSYIYYASVTVKFTTFSLSTTILPATITINGTPITANASSASPKTAESMVQSFVEQINGKNVAFEAIFVANVFDGFYTPAVANETNAAIFIIKVKTKGSGGSLSFSTASANISFLTSATGAAAQTVINNTAFEAMSPSDTTFEEWNKNIGRPNLVLVNGDKQVRRGNLVRFGENYLLGTSINNLASFLFGSQKDIPGYGNIRKLIAASNNQAEGTVLLCVQEANISSLYIGQTMIKNAGGGQNLSVTDDVIGTVNPLQKLVGTVNPESVVQNNGTVYGFDALRGIVWRYGQDGLSFLSDVGMKSFFYQRSKYLLSLAFFKCYGGIDPYHNEYILTIPNTDAEKKTIAWSETLNRWTSFMSFAPEWMQKVNTQMVSFVSGQLWLHRNNPLYNNFYGIQYESKLKMVCNQEPDITKILQIVEQKSTSHWDCTDIATPEGQSSELLGLFDIADPNTYPQDFRKYDNTTYVGAVMRDKNTPNLQSSDYPLLNGDVIRSDIFTVLMENSETTKQNLYFVNLMYVPSYKKA